MFVCLLEDICKTKDKVLKGKDIVHNMMQWYEKISKHEKVGKLVNHEMYHMSQKKCNLGQKGVQFYA